MTTHQPARSSSSSRSQSIQDSPLALVRIRRLERLERVLCSVAGLAVSPAAVLCLVASVGLFLLLCSGSVAGEALVWPWPVLLVLLGIVKVAVAAVLRVIDERNGCGEVAVMRYRPGSGREVAGER